MGSTPTISTTHPAPFAFHEGMSRFRRMLSGSRLQLRPAWPSVKRTRRRIIAKNTGVIARTSGKVLEFARNAMPTPSFQMAAAA